MPVGEGSIRRAAGKAEGVRKKAGEDNAMIVSKETEKTETKTGTAADADQGKNSGGRKASGRGKTSGGKKSTLGGKKNPETGRNAAASMAESGGPRDNYEVYGIGQPLPTYLL